MVRELLPPLFFSHSDSEGAGGMRARVMVGCFLLFLRRSGGFSLRKIQGISVYRRVARSLRFGIEIKEADEEDLIEIHAWLNPGDPEVSVIRNPHVTDLVAKKGDRVIGFVQLVRHPKKHYPYVGYWIFSLMVRTLYRGMGIGETLCQAVIEKAREEEVGELFLLVRQDNHQIIKLYRKLGFEMKVIPALEEPLEREKLSLGYRRVSMSKSLAGEGLRGRA